METYPNFESVTTVSDFLRSKSEEWKLSSEASNKLQIIADEIYSNIVRYSGADRAEIICRREKNLITLIFCDNGIHYDPTAAKEPDLNLSAEERQIGGLGIYVVKKLTKSIEYKYADNQNCLTLIFDIENL